MAEKTNISWTNHTFNPHRGCTKVSEGCRNCYAESNSRRNLPMFGEWGPSGTRVVAAETGWKEPIKWNKKAETETSNRRAVVQSWQSVGDLLCCDCGTIHPDNEQAKGVYNECGCGRSLLRADVATPEQVEDWCLVRNRVFCASLADVFEEWTGNIINTKGQVLYRTQEHRTTWFPMPEGSVVTNQNLLRLDEVRLRLMRLAAQTPYLDWLLLTKRPENISPMFGRLGEMIDTSEANYLAECHLRNVWLGTSVEGQQVANFRIPYLLNNPAKFHFLSCEPLLGVVDLEKIETAHGTLNAFTNELSTGSLGYVRKLVGRGIDWVIVGGESGSNARPMDLAWARSLRDQCKKYGVAFFFKQLGGKSDKGETFDKIPEDLRIREFPKVRL